MNREAYAGARMPAKVTLSVTAGPHKGKNFVAEGRDSFTVGRSSECHLQLSGEDRYISRKHFTLQINPPRCSLLCLNDRNGVAVNGIMINDTAELKHGDILQAGQTVFHLSVFFEGDLDTVTLHPNPLPGTAASPLGHPIPIVIPGFTIEKELGKGGMGTVYRGIRQRDNQLVALKLMSTCPTVDSKQHEFFYREAKILCTLKHPHIVEFFEMGATGNQLFIAMELIEGVNAKEWVLKTGPLAIPAAVRMVCQALDALQHAHNLGFVHRDVKPQNLLISNETDTERKTLKLADFGIARAFETSNVSGLTVKGDVGGTPAFMAPEQVADYREVKPPADIYSAAAVLYYLLTARYIFDFPKQLSEQFRLIVNAEPIPLAGVRPEIPVALASAIHKALAKKPATRFESAAAFRTALLPFAYKPKVI
jgi:eukaryotic-like serine/threonine-protein kinase